MIALIATAINSVTDSTTDTEPDTENGSLEDVETVTTLSDIVDIRELSRSFPSGWSAEFSLLQSSNNDLDEAVVVTHQSIPATLTIVPEDFRAPTADAELKFQSPSPASSRTSVGTFESLKAAVSAAQERAENVEREADQPRTTQRTQSPGAATGFAQT